MIDDPQICPNKQRCLPLTLEVVQTESFVAMSEATNETGCYFNQGCQARCLLHCSSSAYKSQTLSNISTSDDHSWQSFNSMQYGSDIGPMMISYLRRFRSWQDSESEHPLTHSTDQRYTEHIPSFKLTYC